MACLKMIGKTMGCLLLLDGPLSMRNCMIPMYEMERNVESYSIKMKV